MTSFCKAQPSFISLLDDLKFAPKHKSDHANHAQTLKMDENKMMKAIIEALIGSTIIKKVLTTLAAMVVGAVIAYLTDIGLLDGSGADALANALLELVARVIELI